MEFTAATTRNDVAMKTGEDAFRRASQLVFSKNTSTKLWNEKIINKSKTFTSRFFDKF